MNFGPWWERLGLSGVGVCILTIRVAAAWPKAGWPEVIGLFLCLVVHYGKSFVGNRQSVDRDSVMAELAQMQSDITNLESKMSGIELQKGITTSIGDER